MQENDHLKSRDNVDNFDLAIDDANADYSVSGIPEEVVKRSENFNILQTDSENHTSPTNASRPERSRPKTIVQCIQR